MENAAQDAQDRLREESEEWDVADVEGDGGIPVAVSGNGEERRSGAKKGGPQSNHAARSSVDPKASYKPVTQWGPSANSVSAHGQQSLAKPKEPSARMKARMALLDE